jgi:hypothetical protein
MTSDGYESYRASPRIPTVGDVYQMQSGGILRRVEVTVVEWDDVTQQLDVRMKPIIREAPPDMPEDGDEV